MIKMIRSFLVALAVWSAVALPSKVEAQATWMPVSCTMVPCPGVDANFVDNWYWVQGTGYVSYATLFSHARASAETCTNAVGFITYATSGNPCVTSAGLQIWEARTNITFPSQNLTDAAWSQTTGASVVASLPAPDGTTNAQSLIENTGNSLHRVATPANATVVASSVYSMSVYVKSSGTGAGKRFLYLNGFALIGANANFDLNAGTVSAVATGTAAIAPAANGYYRVSVTGTASSSQTLNGFLSLATSGLATDQTYTGDGLSGLTFFGFQIELGAFPSPYIPTTSGTASRAADVITGTGALNTLPATGAVRFGYSSVVPSNTPLSARFSLIGVGADAGNPNRFALRHAGGNSGAGPSFAIGNGSAVSTAASSVNIAANTPAILGVNWSSLAGNLFQIGQSSVPASGGTGWNRQVTAPRFGLGGDDTSQIDGNITRFTEWPSFVTVSQ